MRDLSVVAHTEATHHVELLVGGCWYGAELTPWGQEDARRVADASGPATAP